MVVGCDGMKSDLSHPMNFLNISIWIPGTVQPQRGIIRALSSGKTGFFCLRQEPRKPQLRCTVPAPESAHVNFIGMLSPVESLGRCCQQGVPCEWSSRQQKQENNTNGTGRRKGGRWWTAVQAVLERWGIRSNFMFVTSQLASCVRRNEVIGFHRQKDQRPSSRFFHDATPVASPRALPGIGAVYPYSMKYVLFCDLSCAHCDADFPNFGCFWNSGVNRSLLGNESQTHVCLKGWEVS